MPPAPLHLVALVAAALATAFLLLFCLAARLRNASIVDAAWGLSFAAVALFYGLSGSGFWPRRLAFASIYGVAGLRLGLHILVRIVRHHPLEDPRYADLRAGWGKAWKWRTLLFFETQAGLVCLLSTPLLLGVSNQAPQLHPLEWLGAALFLVAFSGEALADAQLAHFKSRPESRGLVCKEGLWRASRHPNYFFEWLNWVAIAVFATATAWGFVSFLAPVLMLYFLLGVTGIPLTERQAVKSRGDAYREYQSTTSAFVPWWPKAASAQGRK